MGLATISRDNPTTMMEGIVAHATASSGTVTNAMDAVAWQQSCTDIDDDNKMLMTPICSSSLDNNVLAR
jgi:hypothetical protein